MKTNKQNILFRIAFYIAISIFLTGLILSGMKRGHHWLFWVYIGVMAISSLTAKWFDFSDKEPAFLKWVKHIVYVCVLIMLFLFLSLKYLFN